MSTSESWRQEFINNRIYRLEQTAHDITKPHGIDYCISCGRDLYISSGYDKRTPLCGKCLGRPENCKCIPTLEFCQIIALESIAQSLAKLVDR